VGADGPPDLPTDTLERAMNPAFWQLRWPILAGDPPVLAGTWESAQDYPTFFRAEIRTFRTYTIDAIAPDGSVTVNFTGRRDLAHSVPGAEGFFQLVAFDVSGGLVFDARAGRLLSNRERLVTRARVRAPGEEWRELETTMSFTRTRLDSDPE